VRNVEDAGLERIVAGLVERLERRFYGKYRGFVVDNDDPARLGRLKVRVPSVFGADVVTGWATACVPFGGAADQGFFCIPSPGAGVWIEFEEGDLEFPIWVGTFWSKPSGRAEPPQKPPTCKIFRTSTGHTLQFEDAQDHEAIILKVGVQEHVVVLDASGISISDGQNGHTVILDGSGITITDGQNSGNSAVLDSQGMTLKGAGTTLVVGSSGVKIGAGAAEPLVLGNALKAALDNLVLSLNTHTHVGNLGAPTAPPAKPFTLNVPLSTKHTVE
jgi:uncharacterized protein involved in type VI secretion and phage assembly